MFFFSQLKRPDRMQAEDCLPRNEPEMGEAHIFTDGENFPAAQRLVIILPDANFDVLSLPRRILKMTTPERNEVLLVAKPAHTAEENHLCLSLATLASLVRDPWITVMTQLVTQQPLEQAVAQLSRPGDLLVCFEEHRLPGLARKPSLAHVLAQQTHLPVYTLKGTVRADPLTAQRRWMDPVLLLLCLAALVVFFFIQVWFDQHTAGALRTCILIMASAMELWTIGRFAMRSIHF
jgi:hypothetical protein